VCLSSGLECGLVGNTLFILNRVAGSDATATSFRHVICIFQLDEVGCTGWAGGEGRICHGCACVRVSRSVAAPIKLDQLRTTVL
jgi:hypothetical protein